MNRSRLVIGRGLAVAFLAGEWAPEAMAYRARRALGMQRAWPHRLALAARHRYPTAPRDRPDELAAFLAATDIVGDAISRSRGHSAGPLRIRHWFVAPTAMGRARWPVAPLDTLGDLRDLLGLSASHLAWFADARSLERSASDERLRHYRYAWVPKRSGGRRLIEAPKPMLKHFQRVLLRDILDQVPVHGAVHGFTRGRSAVTYATAHTGRPVVLHLDLADFFAAVGAGRVYSIYRTLGYPEHLAHALTALSTNAVPSSSLAGVAYPLRSHLAHPHLPQGAPTSPALANLAAFRLDSRLAGLSQSAGARYTRYADDLAISFEIDRTDAQISRLLDKVGMIVRDEGFRLNTAKTSVRRSAQRQYLAGIVVNEKPNIARNEYDTLKAILHNAARFGPASQNTSAHPDFSGHLLGRIGWVNQLNPTRGAKLLTAHAAIDW